MCILIVGSIRAQSMVIGLHDFRRVGASRAGSLFKDGMFFWAAGLLKWDRKGNGGTTMEEACSDEIKRNTSDHSDKSTSITTTFLARLFSGQCWLRKQEAAERTFD